MEMFWEILRHRRRYRGAECIRVMCYAACIVFLGLGVMHGWVFGVFCLHELLLGRTSVLAPIAIGMGSKSFNEPMQQWRIMSTSY